MPFNLEYYAGADPADRFFLGGGGKSWRRGPNLPPLSSFSTDLGHFILTLLYFDIYFFIMLIFKAYFVVGGGGQTGHFRPLGGMAPYPLDQPMTLRMLNVATG